MRSPRDAWPEFLKLWERFVHESESPGIVVLVEGEKDRATLRDLGVRGRILLVHSGHRLGALADRVQAHGSRVIVLTDWDREGGHLAQRLAELLDDGRVTFDLEFRRRLARAVQREVVHVEGLATWARRAADRAGAPLDHWLTSPFR